PTKSFTIHPMKGPMTTQTLGGLFGLEPFHWRGDRAGLIEFNGTFQSLMGGSPLAATDMHDFAQFLQSIVLPPNPNQNLDRSYPSEPAGESARDGSVYFRTTPFGGSTEEKTCIECHSTPSGASAEIHNGRNSIQYIKIPQL